MLRCYLSYLSVYQHTVKVKSHVIYKKYVIIYPCNQPLMPPGIGHRLPLELKHKWDEPHTSEVITNSDNKTLNFLLILCLGDSTFINLIIFCAKPLVAFVTLPKLEETCMSKRFCKLINLNNYVVLKFQNWFYKMIFEKKCLL